MGEGGWGKSRKKKKEVRKEREILTEEYGKRYRSAVRRGQRSFSVRHILLSATAFISKDFVEYSPVTLTLESA